MCLKAEICREAKHSWHFSAAKIRIQRKLLMIHPAQTKVTRLRPWWEIWTMYFCRKLTFNIQRNLELSLYKIRKFLGKHFWKRFGNFSDLSGLWAKIFGRAVKNASWFYWRTVWVVKILKTCSLQYPKSDEKRSICWENDFCFVI